MDISLSYAKILGEANFQLQGSKAKDVKEERRRAKVGYNNGQLGIATQSRHGQKFFYLLACFVSCDASCEKKQV